jgi:G:T-mismatch repair DNA endonuclease (very short patch repair protein)
MIDEEDTFRKFGYYSTEWAPHSKKRIIAKCDDCGKIREMNKGDYSALCKSCVRKGKRNPLFGKHHSEEALQKISQNRIYAEGENHPNWKPKIKLICQTCGKLFYLKPSGIKKGKGKFCSRKCKEEWQSWYNKGSNNPAWKGGPIRCECKECGKIFYTPLNEIKKGWGKYCSRQCQTQGIRRNKNKPTKPERIFEEICNRNGLPFKYIGDRSFWLGNANPDFIHNTRKLVCEVFGDFWHSPLLRRNMRYNETLEGRRAQLKAEGYKLIMFWETDLLRKDAEAYVLNTLQKLKI